METYVRELDGAIMLHTKEHGFINLTAAYKFKLISKVQKAAHPRSSDSIERRKARLMEVASFEALLA